MPEWKRYLREHLELSQARKHRDERMVAELVDHLEQAYAEALATGASPDEAEAMAKAELGDPGVASRELLASQPLEPTARAGQWFERREDHLRAGKGSVRAVLADGLRDLRMAVRSLRARPLFSGVVVLVLTLGIGATTAIFTLADAIVLSPLAFHEPDRLVSIHHTAPARGVNDAGQCAAWHLTYEDENQTLQDIGMYSGGSVTVTGAGDPRSVEALFTTSGTFRALRIDPVLGRSFTPEDEQPDAPLEMLISEGYWRSQFGSDPGVIGQVLRVNGASWQVVGVMPEELRSLEQNPDLILPFRFDRATLFVGNIGYDGVARLRDGVTEAQAEADLARMLPMAWDKFPGGNVASSSEASQYTAVVQPLKTRLVGSVANLLWVLLGGVAVVLLIACANVANLFLVRAEGKESEMAIRTAMGASAARIGWEYMRESLLLGLLGGTGGLALAYGGLRLLIVLAPAQLPRLQTVTVNPTVLLFVLCISVGTGLLFGLLPALRHRHNGLAGVLKEAGRGTGAKGAHTAQGALAVSQMALALVLLVGSGLMFRSIRSLQSVETGFDGEEDVLALRLTIPSREIPDAEEAAATFERIARRLEEVPGVTSVATATRIPMDFSGNVNPFYVDGIPHPGGEGPPPSRRHNWIGEGFFETLQIPLVAGRTFTWDDVHNRFPGAILSESLAREYFDSPEEAIGHRVAARPEPLRWHEVIGVASDVRYGGVSEDPELMVYWPQVTLGFWEGTDLDQVQVWRGMGYAIRSNRVGTPGLIEDVREAIWEVAPNSPLRDVRTMPELMAVSIAQTSFTLSLLAIAAGVALLLGVIGVYGVISYAVSQRTREMGVRLALGAASSDVEGMVVRQGLLLSAIGVGTGLVLASGLTRLMSGLLYGVSATDPLTFAVVALGLTLVALVASYVPARRAARVDPVVALKPE